MALQDKFDSIFTNAVLRNTLIGGIVSSDVRNVAQNDNASVSPANIVKMSNSLTSLQNAFNKIYTHSLNVRNLHRYDEKRLLNIKKESNLESRISRPPNIPIQSAAAGSSDTTVMLMGDLTSSVENLTKKLEQANLANPGGGGALTSAAGTAGGLAAGMSKFGRKLLGPLGIALDVGVRAQEGQAVGQIAAGVGGGAAGGWGGAASGAALGTMIAPGIGTAIGGVVGGLGGYLLGSFAGDTAYEHFERRAAGGPVKMGGTYVVGERGPEVLTLTGASGRITASGRRGQVSDAERVLMRAAKKSTDARRQVEEGKPLGPTSYSAKLSGYLSTLYRNMPTWLDRIKNWLGIDSGAGAGSLLGSEGAGSTQNAEIAMAYFMSPEGGGWSREQAAGIVGNLQGESGANLNPNSINHNDAGPGLHSYGIAQWNRERWTALQSYAAETGRPWNDLHTQLGFIQQELTTTEAAAARRLRAARDPAAAALAMTYYERFKGHESGTNSLETRKRIANSQTLFNSGTGPSMSGFISPATGRPGSSFRSAGRPGHEGIDYPLEAGSPVHAAKGGTISSAGPASGYGNLLIIDHGDGVTTRYAHLRSFTKRSGTVRAGEIVARSGGVPGEPGAGRTTGAHLHFEIRVRGRPVNPANYLPTTTSAPSSASILPASSADQAAANRVSAAFRPQVPITRQPARAPVNSTQEESYRSMISSPASQNLFMRYFDSL